MNALLTIPQGVKLSHGMVWQSEQAIEMKILREVDFVDFKIRLVRCYNKITKKVAFYFYTNAKFYIVDAKQWITLPDDKLRRYGNTLEQWKQQYKKQKGNTKDDQEAGIFLMLEELESQ